MIASLTTVRLIGFKTASVIRDIASCITAQEEFEIELVDPNDFLSNKSDKNIPHMVCITQDMCLRQQVCNKLDQDQYKRFTFVHDSAVCHANVKIGQGCFIAPFVTLGSDCVVAQDCIVSPYAMISHRACLGSGSIMQPYSMIAGSSIVGQFCKLNARSTVLDRLSVIDGAELGAGTMVTKNILEPGFYLGTVARKKL